ncbi:MAG: class D sortase [Solirubrobacteraceae bacterium]
MSEILFTMRKPRRRRLRFARALSWLLIFFGVLALADAAVTLAWREPITALIASIRQEGTEHQLAVVEHEAPSQRESEVLQSLRAERRRVRFLAQRLEARAAAGSAVGRITIPHIHISYAMIKGSGEAELELGPGVYSKTDFPTTSFPGVGNTTAIAGHRTTWLAPFRRINELHRGDRILVMMPYGRFTYIVTHDRIVPEADVEAVVAPSRTPHVVLSACYPLFSAEKRILVFARLASIQPRGAAVIHEHSHTGAFAKTLSPSELAASQGESEITSGARSRASARALPRS